MTKFKTDVKMEQYIVVDIFDEILHEGTFKDFHGYFYCPDVLDYLIKKKKELPKVYVALPEAEDDACWAVWECAAFRYQGNPKAGGLFSSLEEALKGFFSICKDQMDEHEFHELVQNIVWMLDDGWDEIEEPTHLRGYAHSLGNIARAAL